VKLRLSVRRLVAVAAGVAVLGLAVGSAIARTAESDQRPTVVRGLPPSTFAAISFDGPANLYSARTGAVIRQVLPETRRNEQLTDLERFPGHDLLATYYQGMQCRNGAQTCVAAKEGCGGRILGVDPATGDVHRLWRLGPHRVLGGATASPDGRQIAALVEPCSNDAYFSAHLLVRRLSDGKTWTIGRTLTTCHFLSTPAWTGDNRTIVVSYGASSEQPNTSRTGDGTSVGCPGWHRVGQVRLNADHSQPGLIGTVRNAPKHCDLSTPVIRAGRRFDLKTCAVTRERVRATIERLDPAMRPQTSWRLAPCEQDADLALNSAGQLLISTYDFCNPPLPGHKRRDPISHLYRLTHHRLMRIASAKGGNLAWGDIVP
jgi:hypothetical protein